MLHRLLLLTVLALYVAACATPDMTIGLENKFKGDTRSNLEIGDTPTNEANRLISLVETSLTFQTSHCYLEPKN